MEVSITLTFIKNNMFEKILTRIVVFIFVWIILWGAFEIMMVFIQI